MSTAKLTLTSTAFAANQPVPRQYTGDGADSSPPLSITGVPQGTKELALICDDPDAPVAEPWVHWVIYGIPPATAALPEGLPRTPTLAALGGAVHGKNTEGKIGYAGPCPPRGHGVHHYHFRLYALSEALNAPPGLDKKQLLAVMKGNVLAEAELVGTYQR